MDILAEARSVLKTEMDSIQQIIERLDEKFIAAVELLYNCKGKVVISGLGKSGLVGRKIASTLSSTGTPAMFLHSAEGVHGDLGLVVRGDVAVLISNSGETEETLNIIPSIKRIGVPILALGGRPNSSLAQYAEVFLDVGVEREACPIDLVPTASTTTLLAVGDALAVVLLKKRGFQEEDFACLHPGGTIGKRLLLTVADVMHAGEANPVVPANALMKEAVIEMTSKGLGAVCVVDQQGKLVGVITDGDLRRAIEKYPQGLLRTPVTEIMTVSPVTIVGSRLAAKAVHLMEDRPSQISILPVIDDEGKSVGLLRLHDLVKSGVI